MHCLPVLPTRWGVVVVREQEQSQRSRGHIPGVVMELLPLEVHVGVVVQWRMVQVQICLVVNRIAGILTLVQMMV